MAHQARAGLTAHRRAGLVAINAALILSGFAEAIPIHFWLHGRWRVGIGLLHAYSIVWLLGDLQALRLRPMTVENGVLQLRIGLRWEARILLSSIAFAGAPEPFNHSLNESPSGSAPLRVGVIGSPNVVLRFTEPQTLRPIFGRERRTTAMALLVDDPVAFIAALQAQEQGPQSGVHQSS